MMRKTALFLALSCLSCPAPARDTVSARDPAPARDPGNTNASREISAAPLSFLTRPLGYISQREGSWDRSGGNADLRRIAPGDTLTLMDTAGPAVINHVWMTIASKDPDHLKNLILRMYWDDEESPSVEAPVGAFFGLGLGDYVPHQSTPLAVAPDRALNSFFPMPFRRRARITVENQGPLRVDSFYYNIDYRAERAMLPDDTLYFHAQYRQACPCAGDNYVYLTAEGRGHLAGITLSVVENADGWWGEGDEMFYVDGERQPSIHGTGSEDYFLGAWDFGGKPFAYGLFGAPVVGRELRDERWSMYRFHLDAPITFERSLRATMEHGNVNDRADDFASVAYWYQTEPHAPFPTLPPAALRHPRHR